MDELTERALAKLAATLHEVDRELTVRLRELELALSDLRAKIHDLERLAR